MNRWKGEKTEAEEQPGSHTVVPREARLREGGPRAVAARVGRHGLESLRSERVGRLS